MINNSNINRRTEKKIILLLVEDDEDVRINISEALAIAGYKVFACATVREAIANFDLEKCKYSLCIIDYGLPDTNGAEIIKNFILRKPEINILFTTGYNELILQDHSGLIGQHQIYDETIPFT